MSGAHDLVVRRMQRHDVVLRGRISVAPEHAQAVKLGKGAGVRDGAVDADVIDLSGGGLGVLCPVFLPKRLMVEVRIFGPNSAAPAFTCRGRVSRSLMTDRRPMYLLGITFEEMDAAATAALSDLLAQAGQD